VTGMDHPVDPIAMPPAPRVSVWNIANGLTAVRIVLVPLFAWLLLEGGGRSPWRWAAAGAFAVAVATDRFDGEVARRWGLITDVGKIADPIADKALIGTALVCLSLMDELSWWVTAAVLAREAVITALRFVVIRRAVLPAGRGGKIKTASQALAITLYLVPLPGSWHVAAVAAMAVAVGLTLVTGVDYVISIARVMRRVEASG
jgi:CDP-diacylglycerol---glycerol-3-phosphate 3-phosphatidyltransferase